MKTILIILFLSTMSLLSYSQTKEYYKKNGDINVSTKERSVNAVKYKCERYGRTSKITNANNKLTGKSPLKKDGSPLSGDMLDQVVFEDPELFCKIATNILKKYGFEVYTLKEWFEVKLVDPTNRFTIRTYYDSSNGKILEAEFWFFADENTYASYLPIEFYAEMEAEIKKQVKVTINEEGKTRIFCTNLFYVAFRQKS